MIYVVIENDPDDGNYYHIEYASISRIKAEWKILLLQERMKSILRFREQVKNEQIEWEKENPQAPLPTAEDKKATNTPDLYVHSGSAPKNILDIVWTTNEHKRSIMLNEKRNQRLTQLEKEHNLPEGSIWNYCDMEYYIEEVNDE